MTRAKCDHKRARKICGPGDEVVTWQCVACLANGVRSLGSTEEECATAGPKSARCDECPGTCAPGTCERMREAIEDNAPNPEIAGCPRNECQIRNVCTRPTVCLSHAALTAAEYEAQRAAEPDCRDEDDAPVPMHWAPIEALPTFLTCTANCGAATALEAAPVMGWAMVDGQWYCIDHRSRVKPTAKNCKLLGAERCEHSDMTATETQAVFGKDGLR